MYYYYHTHVGLITVTSAVCIEENILPSHRPSQKNKKPSYEASFILLCPSIVLPKPKLQCPVKSSSGNMMEGEDTMTNITRGRASAVSKYYRHFDKRCVCMHQKHYICLYTYICVCGVRVNTPSQDEKH